MVEDSTENYQFYLVELSTTLNQMLQLLCTAQLCRKLSILFTVPVCVVVRKKLAARAPSTCALVRPNVAYRIGNLLFPDRCACFAFLPYLLNH